MFSQHQKIIARMCLMEPLYPHKWWYAPDFMVAGHTTILGQHEDLFVGYEASARLSELAKQFPNMIESRREGKYFYRRIRLERLDEWYNDIPEELKFVVSMYFHPPQEKTQQRSLL